MKKALKVIGIILGVILVCVILLFEVSAFDLYIDSKIVKAKTPVVQAPPAGITIPMNSDYSVSTFNIELTATPEELKTPSIRSWSPAKGSGMIREKLNGQSYTIIISPWNNSKTSGSYWIAIF